MCLSSLPGDAAFIGIEVLGYRCRNAVMARAISFAQRRMSLSGSCWWKLLGGSVGLLYGPVITGAAYYSSGALGRFSLSACRRYNDSLVRQLDPAHSAFRRVYFAPDYYSPVDIRTHGPTQFP